MRISHIAATLLVTVALGGCSPTAGSHGILGALRRLEVGPDYARPATEMPERFRGQPESIDPASLADLPWWEVFGDPALQQLVREALQHNYDLETAVARVEQFHAQVGVAAADLYPQIGYQGAASREKAFVPILPGGNRTFNDFSAALDVAWEIDIWGRIRRATESARAQFLASEDVRRGVMLTLVSDVAAGYFQLLELDREREIARSSAEAYQHTLALFTDRFEGGKDTKLSTSRAEASLQASVATIARLEQAIIKQEDALSELAGAPPGPIERGHPLVEQSSPTTPVGLTTELLQRRPDIVRAEHDMMSANAEIGVAVANFFPRIGLTALYGGESGKIGDVLKNNFSIWNVAGSMAGPIFQGGRLVEQYHARQAFWDESIAAYKATIVRALREVADGLAAQSKLVDERAAEERQVEALATAVDLSLLRYRTGLATYFEVLEAEQQLYPAQDQLAQSQRDQLLTVVGLYKALGGGWKLTDAAWTTVQ